MAVCTSGLRWAPAQRPCLIAVSDDATERVLHVAFYPKRESAGGDDQPGRLLAPRRPPRCSTVDTRPRTDPKTRALRGLRSVEGHSIAEGFNLPDVPAHGALAITAIEIVGAESLVRGVVSHQEMRDLEDVVPTATTAFLCPRGRLRR